MTHKNLSADTESMNTAAEVIEFGVKVQCHNKNNKLPISGARNILLAFECTINPQNLIKIVETLNFRGRGKSKKTCLRY